MLKILRINREDRIFGFLDLLIFEAGTHAQYSPSDPRFGFLLLTTTSPTFASCLLVISQHGCRRGGLTFEHHILHALVGLPRDKPRGS